MNKRPFTKTIKQALNPGFLKQKPERKEIELFKKELVALLDRINPKESEEFHKNLITDFLNPVYYRDNYYINTKGKNDLVIHNGKDAASSVGVLIEVKRPTNKTEMVTHDNLDVKSFQELVLYYLQERKTGKNFELRYLMITNVYEWFVFDAQDFEKLFYQDKALLDRFEQFQAGKLSGTSTDFFYKEIASPEIRKRQAEIPCIHLDVREYEDVLRKADKEHDRKLIALYKFLSPVQLLKLPFANDNNQLNKAFYAELLHIIGLEEVKEGQQKFIRRKKEKERDDGSLLENAIDQIKLKNKLGNLPAEQFGKTEEEQLFGVALDLAITWINRILFLKLLESQIVRYHKGNSDYAFLSPGKISGYSDLNMLFFAVLACKEDERKESLKSKFADVPYLNSSLFERTDVEDKTIDIDNLQNDIQIALHAKSILHGKDAPQMSGIRPLEYLLRFLDAYDFSSEGSEDIQEENKPLISASVLGLIFEKINGYKDGSFFTPSFITMYMCREAIGRAVIQKFNEAKGWKCQTIEDLYNKIEDIPEANAIFNSVRICDPSVGSGHFLVSALNEMIYLKSELGILADKNGKRLKSYRVAVANDELIVADNEGEYFAYNPKDTESQRVQETFFREKQILIENCLFGVDINPNSVKICQLRLWIELLKHAYYRTGTNELETLPNIDINIKCGNSLISRFDVHGDYRKLPALMQQKLRDATGQYKSQVRLYKSTNNKAAKKIICGKIAEIKATFSQINDTRDKDYQRLMGLEAKLKERFFSISVEEERESWEQEQKRLATEYSQLKRSYEQKLKTTYSNAFEWSFEFPEILDDSGNFVGFDMVIGNPPYVRLESIREMSLKLAKMNYQTYDKRGDLYQIFVERGFSLLHNGGFISYIMPNKWMQTGYGKLLREYLLTKELFQLIDFGDIQIFTNATTYPCIFLARNANPKNEFLVSVLKTLNVKDFNGNVAQTAEIFNTNQFSGETWVISSQQDSRLLERLKKKNVTLEKFVNGEANYGIKTALTEAFLITRETKNQIVSEDPKAEKLIKPFLQGRDVKRYDKANESNYLILFEKGFTNKRTCSLSESDAWDWISNTYPSISKWLKPFASKGKKRTDKGDYWWELRACDYYNSFSKPKIMYQAFQVKPCFIFDEQGLFCNNSMWFIPTDNKVLLAILNSKMGWWLIRKYCTQIQNGYQLIWKYFGQIPIPDISLSQQGPIVSLVEKILSAKKSNPQADTSDLEQQIDTLVYGLYGLTEEEIKIVGGK